MGNSGWGTRRPVQVTEPISIETQFEVPVLKSWLGLSVSAFMVLAPTLSMLWLAEEAFTSWSFWWALGGIACISVMAGGIGGFYWFRKELVQMYEPTGEQVVELERLKWEKEKWEREQSQGQSWEIVITEERENDRGRVTSLEWGWLEFEKVTPEEFAYFVRVVTSKYGGDDLTYGRWTPNPFSRPQYDEVTGQLEAAGIIQRRGNAKNSPRFLADVRALKVWLKHFDGHDGGE